MTVLDLPSAFSLALFVEVIFSRPGMGRLLRDAACGRAYPAVIDRWTPC